MTPQLLAIAVGVGETLEGLDLRKGQFAKLPLGGGVFSRVNPVSYTHLTLPTILLV